MVAFFEKNTALHSRAATRSPTPTAMLPGAGTGGRSVIAAPYDARGLGDLVHRLRLPMRETTFLGMTIQAGPDLAAFMNVTRSPRAFAHVARRFGRHLIDLALHRRGMQLRNGIALVGAAAALGRRSRRRAADLLARRPAAAGRGSVRGAVLARRRAKWRCGRPARRRARGRRLSRTTARAGASMFPADEEHLTVAAPSATGDGLRLGESVGRRRRRHARRAGRLVPGVARALRDGTVGRFPHIIERGKPGIIGVLADGRRFCNEGNGYHDYVAAMLRAVPPGQEVASWLVCTRAFQRRYGLGIARPTPLPVGPYIRSGYIKTGRTIAELAPELRDRPRGVGADDRRLQCARPQRARTPRSAAAPRPTIARGGDPKQRPTPAWRRSSTARSSR